MYEYIETMCPNTLIEIKKERLTNRTNLINYSTETGKVIQITSNYDKDAINGVYHEIDGMLVPYADQFVWASIATLFGLPATAAPIGHTENGLPIGIQIIGDYLEDYTTIKFAELLECEFGRFSLPYLQNLV